MKINFDAGIENLDGTPSMERIGKGEEAKDVHITLKSICTNALLAQKGNEEISGEEKVRRYEMAKSIFVGGEIDLTVEQITLLKDRIGKLYTPIIVGQTFRMLEGK